MCLDRIDTTIQHTRGWKVFDQDMRGWAYKVDERYWSNVWYKDPNDIWIYRWTGGMAKHGYRCGYHCFLDRADAVALSVPSDWIVEVEIADVVACGTQYYFREHREVVVARRMLICPG